MVKRHHRKTSGKRKAARPPQAEPIAGEAGAASDGRDEGEEPSARVSADDDDGDSDEEEALDEKRGAEQQHEAAAQRLLSFAEIIANAVAGGAEADTLDYDE
eukprot:jgi/Tetstr1/445445/TSEL_033224.t1